MKLLKRPLFQPAAAKPKPKAPVHKLNASASRTASRADLEDYADYDEEDSREPNMRLTHAFVVVLILHVIAVGGVFGFNAMKSRQAANAKTAATPVVTETAAPVAVAPTTPVAAPAPVVARPVAPVAPAPVVREERDIIPGPTAPAALATSGNSHQVVPGDTLSKIASKYQTSIEALEKTNGLVAGSLLQVGQVIQLPTASSKTAASAPAVVKPTEVVKAAPVTPAVVAPAPVAKAAPAAATGETYTIAKGDNPYSVAKKLKVSYNELMKINNITDPTKLQIGQVLKIPAAQP